MVAFKEGKEEIAWEGNEMPLARHFGSSACFLSAKVRTCTVDLLSGPNYVLTCDTISWYLWHFKQVFHRGCKLSGGTVTIETTLWLFFCSVDSPFKKVVASTSQLFLYISQPPANAFHCFKKWKTSGFIFKPSYPQTKPGLKGISLENMNGKLQNTKPPFILVHGMYFVQNIGTCCT